MRTLIALLALTGPASAWVATADGPVCRLSHDMSGGTVEVVHDPRRALPYSIEVTRDTPWIAAPVFAMRFDGPGQITITTDRHMLSDDSTSLTVMDRGFGNVLSGLENNFVAMAVLGNDAITIPLRDAAPEVAKFRACTVGTGV